MFRIVNDVSEFRKTLHCVKKDQYFTIATVHTFYAVDVSRVCVCVLVLICVSKRCFVATRVNTAFMLVVR